VLDAWDSLLVVVFLDHRCHGMRLVPGRAQRPPRQTVKMDTTITMPASPTVISSIALTS